MQPYEKDDENAIPTPKWLGVLRGLVFGLLFVSIIAMGLVGFAAFRLIMSAAEITQGDPLENFYQSDMLPEGAELVSLSPVHGGTMVIFEHEGALQGRYYDQNGVLQSETVFE